MEMPGAHEPWHSVQIDDEVFRELQIHAVPLVDDPNSVLRRILHLDTTTEDPGSTTSPPTSPANSQTSATRSRPTRQHSNKRTTARTAATPRGERAPKGSLLPESEYELPLLKALNEAGGSGPASEIVERVGQLLAHKLTDTDRELVDTGKVRWKNRIQFVRLGLIKTGLMKKDSPRGIWEISDSGRSRLEHMGGVRHGQ